MGIEVFFLAGIQSRCTAQKPHILATRLPGTPFHLLPAEQKSLISFIMSKMENGSSADLSERIPTVGIFSLAFIAARIHIYILLFLLILLRFARQLTNAMLFHQQTHFEEESEFPLWEFELEAKSNQDFNIFLKSDQTRYRSHRIRSRSDNSHRGNLVNHIIGLIHQYYSNFKNDTKYENK